MCRSCNIIELYNTDNAKTEPIDIIPFNVNQFRYKI